KLLEENSPTKDKIIKAFRLIVSRKPTEKEVLILTNYYEKERKKISETSAKKLLTVGEYPIPATINKPMLAALMRVVNTIYNLEETITKS
ncbi:MAG: hypothetical protein EAZ29_07720, partial [Runella slithyformis]